MKFGRDSPSYRAIKRRWMATNTYRIYLPSLEIYFSEKLHIPY